MVCDVLAVLCPVPAPIWIQPDARLTYDVPIWSNQGPPLSIYEKRMSDCVREKCTIV